MATSYFPRATNPLRRRRTTAPEFPGPNSNPVTDGYPSPTFSEPMPMAPTIEAAPPRAVAPPVSVVDPLALAAEEYASTPVVGVKNRILEALKTAGMGALQAAAQNREDPLGAAIGGAATGGAISAISPRAGRAYQFEAFQRPGLEAEERRRQELLRRQQTAEDRARSISLDELRRRQIEADIADTEAQMRARVPRVNYESVGPGQTLINPVTKEIIYQAPAAPTKIPQALKEGPDGNYYDWNDPVQREQLQRLNAKLPRDRFGRFISRSDERASAPKPARPKKEQKFASMDDVRAAAEKQGISVNEAATQFRNAGYMIEKTRY